MDSSFLTSLALDTKFLIRKRKLSPKDFLYSLVFKVFEGNKQSLSDHCVGILKDSGISITKQSLDSKFNTQAVNFLKGVLSKLSEGLISDLKTPLLSNFSNVFIQDATRFGLPKCMNSIYKGFNGDLSAGQIQFVYDIKKGCVSHSEFVSATVNESTNAINCTWIEKRALILRDLGYFNINGLKEIDAKEAFFISRVKPKTILLTQKENDSKMEELDISTLVSKMKSKGVKSMSLNVLLGTKDRYPTKAVISLVSPKVLEERIRKANNNAKTRKWNVSKEYIAWSSINVYITNIPEDKIKLALIPDVYRLRWQIEIVFKCWKSYYKIHLIKSMKKERMECYILSSLICFLCHYKVFHYIRVIIYENLKVQISIIKYCKLITQFENIFKKVFVQIEDNIALLIKVLHMHSGYLKLDIKNHKKSLETLLNY